MRYAAGNEVITTGRRASKLDEAKARHPELHTIVSDAGNAASVAALAT
jgi:short-subunit dehydrogenase involved in D-alanine esterification of teichoic acids